MSSERPGGATGSAVVSLAFSPDGKTVVSGNDTGLVKFWHVASGKNRATLRVDSAVAFIPDGKTPTSGSGQTVKLWDVQSSK